MSATDGSSGSIVPSAWTMTSIVRCIVRFLLLKH
jgi:hypothetical protein